MVEIFLCSPGGVPTEREYARLVNLSVLTSVICVFFFIINLNIDTQPLCTGPFELG